MPFKSKAQVRKFEVLLREGKITPEQHKEWHDSTPNIKRLPERLKKKKKKSRSFAKGFEKAASVFTMKNIHAPAPVTTATKAVKKVEQISDSLYRKATKAADWVKPEGKIDAAIRRHNEEIFKKHKALEHMRRSIKKTAEVLAEKALLESAIPMQDAVPGTSLRDSAETGQAKGRATRTKGVRNEDREFSNNLKTKYDTSRGGRRYGYN